MKTEGKVEILHEKGLLLNRLSREPIDVVTMALSNLRTSVKVAEVLFQSLTATMIEHSPAFKARQEFYWFLIKMYERSNYLVSTKSTKVNLDYEVGQWFASFMAIHGAMLEDEPDVHQVWKTVLSALTNTDTVDTPDKIKQWYKNIAIQTAVGIEVVLSGTANAEKWVGNHS